jgi:hypothetical protein
MFQLKTYTQLVDCLLNNFEEWLLYPYNSHGVDYILRNNQEPDTTYTPNNSLLFFPEFCWADILISLIRQAVLCRRHNISTLCKGKCIVYVGHLTNYNLDKDKGKWSTLSCSHSSFALHLPYWHIVVPFQVGINFILF